MPTKNLLGKTNSQDNMKIRKLDVAIWSILVIVPLLCIVIFFLPISVQEVLKARTAEFNPTTLISSSFVHGSIVHLLGNVVVFAIVGILLYGINTKIPHKKSLLYSLLLIVFVLPLLCGTAFQIISNYYGWNLSSFGLSLEVSGLLGLMVPTLVVFFREELQNSNNRVLFFFSMFLVTASFIILPYLTSIYTTGFFVAMILSGYTILFIIFRKMLRFRVKKGGVEKKMFLGASVFFVYIFLITTLFPSNILESQGSLVNIFAHYFGVFFGMTMGFIVLKYTK